MSHPIARKKPKPKIIERKPEPKIIERKPKVETPVVELVEVLEVETIEAPIPDKVPKLNDLLVCTAQFPTYFDHQLEMLRESCLFYNLDFAFWGDGIKGAYNARKVKVAAFLDFLEGVEHPYVLFTDGWDSWMLANEQTILDIYYSFEKPVVVAGHPYIYPDYLTKPEGSPFSTTIIGLKAEDFPEVPTKYRYCCAGQFMGEKEALKEVLTIIRDVDTGGPSDQGAWNASYGKHKTITHLTDIDYNCELFLTYDVGSTDDIDDLSFDQDRRMYYKYTKTRPIGIHFGGPKGGSPNSLRMENFYKTWLENR